MGRIPVALTIAGSDPSGGAGIQADLKTFHQFGVYGEAVITLLTVQNTERVSRVVCMDPGLVGEQIEAVVQDIPPQGVKTGALGTVAIIEAVASAATRFRLPLIVDPVLISKHGAPLMDDMACEALRDKLLPHALVVAPNIPEAERLGGLAIHSRHDAAEAARRIAGLGPKGVLVKGGHFSDCADDLLLYEGHLYDFPSPHIDTPHTHGTGCTYSAAITALVAKGLLVPEAVRAAKEFIHRAIATNPGLGRGRGPVNHFA
jgi:hydroxymethylpyrimidine/phosphomethylpyrimidine kinase